MEMVRLNRAKTRRCHVTWARMRVFSALALTPCCARACVSTAGVAFMPAAMRPKAASTSESLMVILTRLASASFRRSSMSSSVAALVSSAPPSPFITSLRNEARSATSPEVIGSPLTTARID